MDSKRTLWIVAAVGLFLLVVVGFALIIYSPGKNAKPVDVTNQPTNDIWASTKTDDTKTLSLSATLDNASATGSTLPSDKMMPQNEMAQGQNANQNGTQFAPNGQFAPQQQMPYTQNPYGTQNVKDLTVISENTHIVTNGSSTIDLNKIGGNSQSQPLITNNISVNSVNPGMTENVVAKTTSETPKIAPSEKPTAQTSSLSAKPSAKSSNTTKTATNAKTASSTKTALPPKFWIQASSYTSKKNAEEARTALSNERISSEIFTFTDAAGNLFYRVRVGPYTTKSEAEYWQTRIKSIDKFSTVKTFITDSSAKSK